MRAGSAGLAHGLLHDIPPCAELIGWMIADTEELITARSESGRHGHGSVEPPQSIEG